MIAIEINKLNICIDSQNTRYRVNTRDKKELKDFLKGFNFEKLEVNDILYLSSSSDCLRYDLEVKEYTEDYMILVPIKES